MNILKILIGHTLALTLTLALALSLAPSAACAHPPGGRLNAPAGFHPFAPSGICADQQYLYVMAGGKIMQYGLTDMTLLKTVDLPEPVPPQNTPPKETKSAQAPPFPPPMHGPQGLWVGGDALYILAGPVVYQYTTPDLKLKTTVKLPPPEFIEIGN